MSPAFSRALLSLSAVVLGAVGMAALFLPAELLQAGGEQPSVVLSLGLQVLGALSFGFAILNWMNRHASVGGIYNRPLVAANLMHFGSTSLSAAKVLTIGEPGFVWLVALVYGLCAVGFGVALFRPPRHR